MDESEQNCISVGLYGHKENNDGNNYDRKGNSRCLTPAGPVSADRATAPPSYESSSSGPMKSNSAYVANSPNTTYLGWAYLLTFIINEAIFTIIKVGNGFIQSEKNPQLQGAPNLSVASVFPFSLV